uniref:Uncharacterized protein n=1 Tax=Amphimedon queenslandica TaxID=400682 RepID=A0A1X7TG27_AMPQE
MKKKMDVEGSFAKGAIDTSRNRYPYSIVWTPLPIITWFSHLLDTYGYMYFCWYH